MLTGLSRRASALLVLLATSLVVPLALAIPAPAAAAPSVGSPGPSTTGAGTGVTGEKPESKLWWNDGRWWASMFDAISATNHIWYLDRAAGSWVDTGTPIDDRPTSRADALWDGTHLYVGSHVKAASNTQETVGQPGRLYRYSYDSTAKTYSLDAGFPVDVNDRSTETLTIDKDSTGRLWATWAQDQSVYVNSTNGSDSSWGTPFVIPVNGATGISADDISTLTTFAGKTGVLWSNQTTSEVYFATHADSAALTAWDAPVVVTPPGPYADDHLDIKTLQSDSSGRVFAVLKTSMDASGNSQAPQIVVVGRDPSTGKWQTATYATVADCHTRPVLVLDSTNNLLHVYATAPDSGCPFTGTPGTIYEKTSPMDNLSFVSGRGTAVMRDASSATLNNVTATKQTVNATSGIVLLASSDTTQRYWWSDESLGGTPPTTTTSTTAPVSTTVTLTPTADSYVTSASPTTNFGTATTLHADGDPIQTSYLRFDLSAYAGRTITGATLQVRCSDEGSAGVQAVRTSSGAWTETGLTYNNRPTVGASIGTLGPTSTNTNYSVALTASALQSSLGGTLDLAIDSTDPDGVHFATRETSTPPKLVLTLSSGSGTTTTTTSTTVPPTTTTTTSTTLPPTTTTTSTTSTTVPPTTTTTTSTTSTTVPPTTTTTSTTSTTVPSGGTTVTLTPGADSYVTAASASTNFGSATVLHADGDPIQASYLRFDLTPYAGRTITSAVLLVRCTDTGSTGLQAIRLVSNGTWTESGLTYNNRPVLGTSIGTLGPTSTNTNYSVTLTASSLQSFLGQLLNIGIDSTDADGVHLASRETSTPPKLVLTFA